MAKGDSVKVTLATPTGPFEAGITVVTRGRKLRRNDTTKAGVRWITYTEVKPSGKATGDSLMIRQDAILSMQVHQGEEA